MNRIILQSLETGVCSFLVRRKLNYASANQIAAVITKLERLKKSKPKRYMDHSMFLPTVSDKKLYLKEPDFRRIKALNKLYMRYISDIMATGSISDKLIGKGIVLSRVEITSDFKIVKVYWIARKNECDEKSQILLNKTAGFIKHELSNLRIMGVIPHIIFVKDLTFSKIKEVEKILCFLDPSTTQETQFDRKCQSKEVKHLTIELPKYITDKIKSLDTFDEEDLPKMNNIFGIDQFSIFERITGDNIKIQKAWKTHARAISKDDSIR